MSDIFAPFEPTPLVPETPAAKPARKPRAKKADKAPKRERVVAAVNPAPNQTPMMPMPEKPTRKPRKKRTVPKVRVPKSIKLPVNQMLLAMAELNTSDGALFEKLLGLLSAAGKGQRQRVLAALGKVF